MIKTVLILLFILFCDSRHVSRIDFENAIEELLNENDQEKPISRKVEDKDSEDYSIPHHDEEEYLEDSPQQQDEYGGGHFAGYSAALSTITNYYCLMRRGTNGNGSSKYIGYRDSAEMCFKDCLIEKRISRPFTNFVNYHKTNKGCYCYSNTTSISTTNSYASCFIREKTI